MTQSVGVPIADSTAVPDNFTIPPYSAWSPSPSYPNLQGAGVTTTLVPQAITCNYRARNAWKLSEVTPYDVLTLSINSKVEIPFIAGGYAALILCVGEPESGDEIEIAEIDFYPTTGFTTSSHVLTQGEIDDIEAESGWDNLWVYLINGDPDNCDDNNLWTINSIQLLSQQDIPITDTDLVFYGPESSPLDDISVAGGDINLKISIMTTVDLGNATRLKLVSSSALDVQVVTIYGLGYNGTRLVEQITLVGTTPVYGFQTFQSILDISIPTDAVGTITIKDYTGVTTLYTIAIGKRRLTSLFKYAFSYEVEDGVVRYEKLFIKNTSVNDLINAIVNLDLDSASNLTIGVDPSFNSSLSIADRLTAPVGVEFVELDELIELGDLVGGDYIGIWLKQTLEANELPTDSSFDVNIYGDSE